MMDRIWSTILSISVFWVNRPKLNRTALRPISCETPIAFKTGDRVVSPE
jgi:hypothetical protein